MNKEIQPIDSIINIDKRYKDLLTNIKERVRSGRICAALAVNHELIDVYWYIGKQIIEKQAKTSWGSKMLDHLSNDLRSAFPETIGFSKRNLEFMRQFAKTYPDQITKQTVSQLPWGQIILLIQRIKDDERREWYTIQSLENGWSRPTLDRYIKQDLYKAQAIPESKASNYLDRLPQPHAGMAQDLLRSPYNFDFLGLHDEAHERDIEHASIQHITKFMLELGRNFAFIGRQVPITIDDNEYFIDMLFYNLKLRCFTVVEIKNTKFKPEHAGQINFYLSAVDDLMRHPDDNPSIGILLCKSRNKFIAEYALRSIEKPIGVSEYHLTKALPDKLKDTMPTIKEIEDELNETDNKDDL